MDRDQTMADVAESVDHEIVRKPYTREQAISLVRDMISVTTTQYEYGMAHGLISAFKRCMVIDNVDYDALASECAVKRKEVLKNGKTD